MELQELDVSAFEPLVEHLSRQHKKSFTLGMTRKRAMNPDLSKQSWLDPKLYHMVMKFALSNIPSTFSFTSVQIHDSSMLLPRFDKHTGGSVWIVSFGSHTDGEIVLKRISGDVTYSIHHRPLIFTTFETDHYFKEFKGRRWVMAFYSLNHSQKYPMIRSLSDYEAVSREGQWVIAWHRMGEPTVYLSKKNGLPMPTNKKRQKEIAHVVTRNERFSKAQNLMLQAQEEKS